MAEHWGVGIKQGSPLVDPNNGTVLDLVVTHLAMSTEVQSENWKSSAMVAFNWVLRVCPILL